jgi:hypothetical protein
VLALHNCENGNFSIFMIDIKDCWSRVVSIQFLAFFFIMVLFVD